MKKRKTKIPIKEVKGEAVADEAVAFETTESADTQTKAESMGEDATVEQKDKTEPAAVPPDEQEANDAEEPMVESLQRQIAALEDKLLREKANFANTQRRLANERSEAVRYANVDLIRNLLPVLDDFERAIEASQDTDDAKSIIEGTRLVYENLLKALVGQGLETIEAKDKLFDPEVHEAMMQQPSDELEPNTVLTELAKGYRFKDRVVRPTKVIVSKAAD